MRAHWREPWFKPRSWGYGATPSTALGWAVTLAYALFVIGMVLAVEAQWLPRALGFVVVLLGTAIYIPVLRAKTAGEWRWRSRSSR